jgi:hypothetical protein
MSTDAILVCFLAWYFLNTCIGWAYAYRMKRVTYDYPLMGLQSVAYFLLVWGVLTLAGRAS